MASNVGYFVGSHASSPHASIYICHACNHPTYFSGEGVQYPGVAYGNDVSDLPTDVLGIYTEGRKSFSVSAYTASVMCMRKVLMNVAVSQGADKGLKFAEYVNWLVENHYTPPGSRDWVDAIRQLGNDANHEIQSRTRDEAEKIIHFVEMLLKFIYQFPAKV
ncbi:DUF4145 domain-containing protein [Patescibacteria group bacterium]|nr:DUF4145 domain-containing protein [Patescibacteria group bacterium]